VLQNKIVKAFNAPIYSYTPPLDPDYAAPKIKDADLAKADRIALAKKLYAEAGFGPDKPLKIQIEAKNDPDTKKEAEGVAVMWKQVLGVQAKVNAQEFQAWYDTFNAGGWDVFDDDFVADFSTPEGFLTYIQPKAGNGYTWQGEGYEANKELAQFQELLDKALLMPDKSERYKTMASAERIFLDEYYTLPLANKSTRYLIKPHVKGWEDNAPGWHPSRFLQVSN
jgi:oligopeptide transport system substrate-binding protein